MSCKKCGQCCRVVGVRMSYADVVSMLEGSEMTEQERYDLEFIKKNWIPVNRKSVQSYNKLIPYSYVKNKSIYWYKCKMFNKTTNHCAVYTERPSVCRIGWFEIF